MSGLFWRVSCKSYATELHWSAESNTDEELLVHIWSRLQERALLEEVSHWIRFVLVQAPDGLRLNEVGR